MSSPRYSPHLKVLDEYREVLEPLGVCIRDTRGQVAGRLPRRGQGVRVTPTKEVDLTPLWERVNPCVLDGADY